MLCRSLRLLINFGDFSFVLCVGFISCCRCESSIRQSDAGGQSCAPKARPDEIKWDCIRKR